MLKKLNSEAAKRELPIKMRNEAGELVDGRERLVWRSYFQKLGKEEKGENKVFDEGFKTQVELEIEEIENRGEIKFDELRENLNRDFDDEELEAAIKKLK